jgi:hypothetical protein
VATGAWQYAVRVRRRRCRPRLAAGCAYPRPSSTTSTVPQSLRCLTRSHASNPAPVAGPGVRCLATAERRQVKVNRATWRFIGRPELADMHAPPARAILTLRRAESAICMHGDRLVTDYSSQSVTVAWRRRLPGRMHHFVDVVLGEGAGVPHLPPGEGGPKRPLPASQQQPGEYAGGQGFRTLLRGSFRRSQRLPSGSISTVIRLSP